MKHLLIALMTGLLSITALAHDGHDHDMPKGLSAPKGGTIKAIERILVEVVSKGNDIKIYIYDKELKPQDAAQYNVTAVAQKPRVKKLDEVTLKATGNMLEATYDAGGTHRYTLVLKVKDPQEKHADTMKFVIEPKK
ncbi:hypothetical protein K2P97_08460 [bacterium]|nr:hypothetical protein [bacterium]